MFYLFYNEFFFWVQFPSKQTEQWEFCLPYTTFPLLTKFPLFSYPWIHYPSKDRSLTRPPKINLDWFKPIMVVSYTLGTESDFYVGTVGNVANGVNSAGDFGERYFSLGKVVQGRRWSSSRVLMSCQDLQQPFCQNERWNLRNKNGSKEMKRIWVVNDMVQPTGSVLA